MESNDKDPLWNYNILFRFGKSHGKWKFDCSSVLSFIQLISSAIGAGIARNPIWIIVPCHRVISKGGKISGYAGGVETKKWLLEHEKKFFAPNMKVPEVETPKRKASGKVSPYFKDVTVKKQKS